METRKTTNRLIELAEDEVLSWEDLARTALNWLSENDVHRMAEVNEFLPDEEDEDDEEDVTYNFEVGDIVLFKTSFKNDPDLIMRAGTAAKISGLAPAFDNAPHYYLEGETAIYPETCFAGRYEE